MLFPKPQTKKKRKKHRESLLQNKESRICYLCARGGDYSWKQVLEEHHICLLYTSPSPRDCS